MQAIGSSGLGSDCCCDAGLQTLGVALLCKNKEEGGRRGLRPWPLRCLNQSLSERKERMLRGRICLVWRCVSELAYLSPMGWPCIYSGCSTSWKVTKGPSHWMECFLFYPISDLVQDIERVIYMR